MDIIVKLVISFFDPRVEGVSVKGFSNWLGKNTHMPRVYGA